jgi:hypothetical protein
MEFYYALGRTLSEKINERNRDISTVIVDGLSEESTFGVLDAPERKFWSTVPKNTNVEPL